MKNILAAIFFTIIVAASSAYIAFEDFQSYTDGDDIADVGPWTNFRPPNEIRCADLGRGVKVGVFYPGGDDVWFYGWDASVSTLNYGVSADFAYTSEASDDAGFRLTARLNLENVEMYEFSVKRVNGQTLFLLYYESFTDYERLWELYVDTPILPNEWHNILFYIHGEYPVTFQFYFDDEKIGSHIEYEYLASGGYVAIGTYYILDTYDLYIDNVMQHEENVDIAPASLGEIKATFR